MSLHLTIKKKHLEGEALREVGFEMVDMRFRLKPRALIALCMPPILMHLEKEANLSEARKQGVALIMHHLRFQVEPLPMVFGRPVKAKHKVKLYLREVFGTPRLVLHMQSRVEGLVADEKSEKLDFRPKSETPRVLAQADVLQVVTKPLAPPEERFFAEVPKPMQVLQTHPWEGEYPSQKSMQAAPEGFRAIGEGEKEWERLWGMPHTDINQHINVLEFIMFMETKAEAELRNSGLPAKKHQQVELEMFFRKPAFLGEKSKLIGQLWEKGKEALYIANLLPQGKLPPEKSGLYFMGRCKSVEI